SVEPGIRLETLLALASFHYYTHDHKKSVRLVEKLAADPASDLHHEIVVVALLLQILIHFEEGNFDVLDYLVAGLKRIGKQRDLSISEKLMTEMASKLIRRYRVKNEVNFFSAYHDKFSNLKKNKFQKNHFNYFHITIWLNKKMNRNR